MPLLVSLNRLISRLGCRGGAGVPLALVHLSGGPYFCLTERSLPGRVLVNGPGSAS
jgi:hypothetical protein